MHGMHIPADLGEANSSPNVTRDLTMNDVSTLIDLSGAATRLQSVCRGRAARQRAEVRGRGREGLGLQL